MSTSTVICRSCGSSVDSDDRFCPECGVMMEAGASVAASVTPANVSAQTVGPGLAAASDAGKSKPANQDAFWLSGSSTGGKGSLVVVCDGVSTSQTPHMASGLAAMRAGEALLKGGEPLEALDAARIAVETIPFDVDSDLPGPSTTAMAVLLRPGRADGMTEAFWAWVGDSRIYWIPLTGAPRLLTIGHVDEFGRLARCLGSGADGTPETGHGAFPSGGWILLCTDGLWGYDPGMDASAVRIRTASGAAEACARLVQYALDCGGRDNVTAALVRL